VDLRSGQCYWPIRDGTPAAHPVLGRDYRADVAVIGAGITGALIADALAAAGLDVVVLDRREAARGSTMASTAIVQYELDLPLVELARRRGPVVAGAMYRGCERGVRELVAIGAGLEGCTLLPRQSLYLASRAADAAGLDQECRARRRIGLDVRDLSAAEVRRAYGLRASGALLSELGAAGDPWLLTHRLLGAASARGARVFARTRVVALEESRSGLTLLARAAGGLDGPKPSVRREGRGRPAGAAGIHRVRVRRAILAAGYETGATLRDLGLALPRLARLKSTYALATAPTRVPPWLERLVIWETARPYFYTRAAPEGRVIIGGADEPFRNPARRDGLLRAKSRRLAGKLRRMLPGTPVEPEFSWAGTFGETSDSGGIIDTHPRQGRLMFVAGYGGNGMALSTLARGIVRDWLLGRVHPDAPIWSLERRPPRRLGAG
jgi:glycine/D-amino acid oxidase-like deaminating enzyme